MRIFAAALVACFAAVGWALAAPMTTPRAPGYAEITYIHIAGRGPGRLLSADGNAVEVPCSLDGKSTPQKTSMSGAACISATSDAQSATYGGPPATFEPTAPAAEIFKTLESDLEAWHALSLSNPATASQAPDALNCSISIQGDGVSQKLAVSAAPGTRMSIEQTRIVELYVRLARDLKARMQMGDVY